MRGHIEEEKIALMARGDLNARETRELAPHLTGCPACSGRLKSYVQDCQAMTELRDLEFEEDDFARVRRSVLHRLREQEVPRVRMHMPFWRSALAVVILAAVTTSVWWWRNTSTPQVLQVPVPERPAQVIQMPVQIKPRSAGPMKPAVNQAGTLPHMRRSNARRMQPSNELARETVPLAEGAKPPGPPASVILDDVFMKLETPDPNVIIIWLASPKGVGR